MSIVSSIKNKIYKNLRHGGFWSLFVYHIAGFVYWLVKSQRFYVGTRVVEIPWAFLYIRTLPKNSSILQFGNVLLQNNDMRNHRVWLLDMDADDISGELEASYKMDIRKSNIPKNTFDSVISISTIEHVGLWGEKFDNGDRLAIEILHNSLRDNGTILFTVPFGKYFIGRNFRVYDSEKLLKLLEGLFSIVCAEYIIWNGWRWVSVPPDVAEKMYFMHNNEDMNCGAAIIIARKK